MAKAKPKPKTNDDEMVDALQWINVRIPVKVDFDAGAYTPKKVTVGWLTQSHRMALRAMLEGMQEEGCRVHMLSTANTNGRPVDRWHHPLLYVLDTIVDAMP